MLRSVHIPRHTWHPAPRFPRSWSFCRWLGHGLSKPHRHIIDALERQRMSCGFVRAYVVDPASADGTMRTLLSQYVRWLGQAKFPLMDPRVVVVDRSARTARHSAKSVPGSRPVSASLADNLRGCPFDIVLMLDAHAYPRRTFAFDTARQALVGAVAHTPGTAVILHGAPAPRSHFRAALASATSLYLKILPPSLESAALSRGAASPPPAESPPPAPESAKVPANSLSQKKSDSVRNVRSHPLRLEKSALVISSRKCNPCGVAAMSKPHAPSIARFMGYMPTQVTYLGEVGAIHPAKAPPAAAVAATAPQPRTLPRTPSSKEFIDILVLFPAKLILTYFSTTHLRNTVKSFAIIKTFTNFAPQNA